MSFFLETPEPVQKSIIKPLHYGFGFGAEEILENLKKTDLKQEPPHNPQPSLLFETPHEVVEKPYQAHVGTQVSQISPEVTLPLPPKPNSSKIPSRSEQTLKNQLESSVKPLNISEVADTNYYAHPFFAFLAWTIDALVGFCFLLISLCINFVFVPKGFFDVSSAFVKYATLLSVDINVFYTLLFSLQVWLCMFILVFLFQYSILGFEGSTLGRWLFGIKIQNNKNKKLRPSESTKICAALSESLLLGGILSFIFIIFFPSRVPIFFWMRYSSKND